MLRLCGASDVLRWLLAMAAGWHLAVTVLVNGAPSSELVCFGR